MPSSLPVDCWVHPIGCTQQSTQQCDAWNLSREWEARCLLEHRNRRAAHLNPLHFPTSPGLKRLHAQQCPSLKEELHYTKSEAQLGQKWRSEMLQASVRRWDIGLASTSMISVASLDSTIFCATDHYFCNVSNSQSLLCNSALDLNTGIAKTSLECISK